MFTVFLALNLLQTIKMQFESHNYIHGQKDISDANFLLPRFGGSEALHYNTVSTRIRSRERPCNLSHTHAGIALYSPPLVKVYIQFKLNSGCFPVQLLFSNSSKKFPDCLGLGIKVSVLCIMYMLKKTFVEFHILCIFYIFLKLRFLLPNLILGNGLALLDTLD